MPYTFGYTIKMPQRASIYGYAGKYDVDGRFIPITKVGYSHNGKAILYSDTLTLEKESGYNFTILRGQASAASGKVTTVSTSGGRNNSAWTISDKSYQYLQWYIESNGTVTQIQRDGQTTDARFYVATSVSAATEAVARWKEVTVIRFAPTYNDRDAVYGVLAKPFPVAEFGTYPTDKKIYEYASEAELIATGNLFDLSGQTAHNYLELSIGSGLAITEGKLTASSTTPANMVTTDTAQAITGVKTFTGPIKITNGTYTREVAKVNTNGGVPYLYLGQVDSRMYLHTGTPIKRLDSTGGEHTILESSNLGSYVDGTTITYANNELSVVSSGSSVEKHGLEGDYCSKYGIVDCPNGILTEGTGKVTLKAGVVMQMTETDGLTTNASDMAHDITSTVDFDLFYTSGSLLEATQVVFSEQEPEDGATGVLAWYNGTQWQFKSNDAGNVWKSAPAVRLAHIHITDGNITRIDYIGNRHLNKVIPVTTDTAQTITGIKTFPAYTKFKETIQFTGTLSRIQNAYGNNLFLDDKSNNTIQLGEASRTTILSNTVKDSSGNKFLTSGDKETIMGYMMPDYSTRTEVPWDTDNTAPTDGYVEVFGEGDGSTSAFVLEYTINGIKTAMASCYATSAHTNFRLPVICPKGTIYSARGGANGHELHFISMKGAV